MATEEENLAQLAIVRTQIIERLVEITKSPKPTYTIDGQKVDWTDYQRMLFEQVKQVDEAVAAITDEPYEFNSTMYT